MIENKHELCGYSNCFRPFVKMRGFMPVCEFHLHNPQKWGKDGMTFTGSKFIKKDENDAKSISKKLGMTAEQTHDYLAMLETH